MSKINIYGTDWRNMIFEGRNKAYGAYQLRAENPKTTIKALITTLVLFGTVAAIPFTLNQIKNKETASTKPTSELPPITLVDLTPLEKNKPEKEETKQPENHKKSKQKIFKHNEYKPTKDHQKVEEPPKNEELEKGIIGQVNQDGNETIGNGLELTEANSKGTITDDTSIIENTITLEKLPEYPGGIQEFYKDVVRKFKNPEVDENATLLKIMVYFVIEKDGTLSNIKVTRDPGYNLGKEAERVLKSMKTKWSPGYKNGQAVRTAYNLPIIIKP